MSDLKKVFAENLKTACIKKDIKQKELAEKANISAQTISAYATGIKLPTIENAVTIAKTLDVSLDWLFGTKGESKVETVADMFNAACLIDYGLSTNIRFRPPAPFPGLGDAIVEFLFEENYQGFVIRCKPGKVADAFFKALKDYETMGNLYVAKTIDEDIFSAWESKTIENLNKIPIDELPRIPDRQTERTTGGEE